MSCIGCGLCHRNCPSEAIQIKNNCAVIYETDCLSCGNCVVKCPRMVNLAAVTQASFFQAPQIMHFGSNSGSGILKSRIVARSDGSNEKKRRQIIYNQQELFNYEKKADVDC